VERWSDPFVFGGPELKAVLLAHAIILSIAAYRYVVRPRLGGPEDGSEDRRDNP
jgi:hypothetical protein